jgi:3-oxoacyl-[acyl-carrier-protein] synthase-3
LASHCQAFDVSLGCSGYVYGIWLAATLLTAGCRRVLLLAGDTISRTLDPSDRGTALLFGDAGSATALEKEAGAPRMHFVLGSDGKGASDLVIPGGGFRPFVRDARMREGFDPAHLFMDGGKVFSFTLAVVPNLVRKTLALAGLQLGDVDAFLLHQANRFMLRHLAKKIGIAPERMPTNIERFGNTSSASIPLLLTSDLAERCTTGPSRLMMVGFGVGLSWASALVELPPLACAETIVSQAHAAAAA